METATDSKVGFKRRRTLKVIGALACLVIAALGVFIWHAYGSARQAARMGTLIMVYGALIDYAEEKGVYPADFVEALRYKGQDSILWEVEDDLEYVASGKPYDPKRNEHLFYEKKPQRYGFIKGWFDSYQRNGVLFRSGEPPGPAGGKAGSPGKEEAP